MQPRPRISVENWSSIPVFCFRILHSKSAMITKSEIQCLPVHHKEGWEGGQLQWESWTLHGRKRYPYSCIHQSSWTKMCHWGVFSRNMYIFIYQLLIWWVISDALEHFETNRYLHHLRNHTWFLVDLVPKLVCGVRQKRARRCHTTNRHRTWGIYRPNGHVQLLGQWGWQKDTPSCTGL